MITRGKWEEMKMRYLNLLLKQGDRIRKETNLLGFVVGLRVRKRWATLL
jgi:hypothetical protein